MFTRKNKRIFVVLSVVVLVVTLVANYTTLRRVEAKSALSTQNQALSTPELIEQAFANGEITYEQRLLYLAYAVYDPSSLPKQFQSDAGWFGTRYVAEIHSILVAQANGLSSVLSETTLAELERLQPQSATVCDQQDGPNNRDSTNFHVNYGTIQAGLSITDYVNSLESAFSIEVTSYGWPKPPFCTNSTGTCANTNPWNKYPVQIADLGNGLYGYVSPGGGNYTGQVGDNPNTGATETDAIASCMVLNQNYSWAGDARGALDVTTAHEFVHSIQFGVGDPTPKEDIMWYESSAAYMEDEVLDSVNDNYQYLWPAFDSCLGEYSANKYSNWLFFRYAAEHNGGTNVSGGGEDIMQAFWNNVAMGQSGLTAYNNALGTKGANLADTFHNYAIAARFMKTCPTASPYCFEEASDYLASAGSIEDHGRIVSIGQSYTGNLQNNYAINWIRLPKRGIYSISFENTSAGGKFRVSIVADTGNALQVTPFPQTIGGNSRVTLPDYEPPAGVNSVIAVITNQSQTSANPSSCTADPYKLSVAPPVSFVIDDTGSMSEEIDDAKSTVNHKVDEFVSEGLFPNYHLLTYKDDVNYRGETADPSEIKNMVNALYASGGGDCPEEMLGALNRIAQEAPYSEAWLMTDAGFHGGLGDLASTIYNLVRAHVTVHPIIYSWCFDLARVDTSIRNNVSLDEMGVTGPRAATLSSVGPESFARLAQETGGHYFQIDSSETLSATTILLNEMVSINDLVLYRDGVGAFGGSLVNDGSFENGPPPASGWAGTSDNGCEWIGDWATTWGEEAYHGTYDFWAGGYCDGVPSTNLVSQNVTVPISETTLSFQYMAYRPSDDDPTPDDYAYVSVNGTPVWQLNMIQSNDTFPNWAHASIDLSAYAGQSIELTLGAVSVGDLTGNVRFDFITWSEGDGTNLSKTYNIIIDSTANEANFLLNTFSGVTNLELFAPDGVPVNISDPEVTYMAIGNAEYYQIVSPQPGVWQAKVSGNGTFELSASGNSSVNLEYLSDTSIPIGNPVDMLVSLSGPIGTVGFQLRYPDGTLLDTVNLLDDGAHQDGSAGDGVYGGTYTPTTTGSFYLHAFGTTTDGSDFGRVSAEVIRVHTLDVAGPPSGVATPGSTVVHRFLITNVGTVTDTFDLTVSSSQDWVNIGSIPSSVTIGPDKTIQVLVEINVPVSAVSGMVDETVLAAVSQSNPLINDAASALTNVVENFSIYLPIIIKQ